MANFGGESPLGADERNEASSLGRISFLEQALWKQFNDATTPEEFSRAWLGLQCALIAGVERGVVVLKESDNGPFAPVAHWQIAGAASDGLTEAAELALAERRGVAQGHDDAGQSPSAQPWCVAYPIIVDEKLFGVAAVEIEPGRRVQLRTVMRQLQWGVGWIEVLLLRAPKHGDKVTRDRSAEAFDLVAVGLENDRVLRSY